MEEKSANELHGVESHGALAVTLGVILPTKGDLTVLERNEPLIGDSDAMGVSSEVLEHLLGTAEGRFRVDNPFLSVKLGQPVFPVSLVGEAF